MRFTLPFEDRNIKPGQAFILHEPTGKEHYVTKVTYEQRENKVVTIVEATPYDKFEGKHRSELR